MTDHTPEPSATQVQIAINTQYIKDFSFESPGAPQIFAPATSAPMLNVGVNVQTRPLNDNVYEVVLLIKLDATLENKKAFIVELAYAGVFTVPPMPEEQLKLFLLVEAPRLLFPFARSIITNIVQDGGFPQLLLNPIDFYALYQSNAAQMNQPPAGSA